MNRNERFAWIEAWMRSDRTRARVDVLDSELVLSYIEATGAKSSLQFIGAPKCKQLGSDLSAMFRAGILKRSPTGLPSGDSSMGFPKWVYVYSLKRAASTGQEVES